MVAKSGKENKKIFIVDDSDIILAQASTILKKRYNVQTFNAAEKMLNLVRTVQVYPDLIILDVEMPNMHGSEVMSHLSESPVWNEVPVLLLTSWESDRVFEYFFAQGALDVIHKPIIPSVMLNRVEKYLKLSELLRGTHPSGYFADSRNKALWTNLS